MGALADAWKEIQSRHPEGSPVVLAVGQGSPRRRVLGSVLPVRQTDFGERDEVHEAFVEAADRGDFGTRCPSWARC
jgi:hypothetical protein